MGIHLMSHMWDERIGELIEPITQAIAIADNDMAADVLLLATARAGDPDRLRAQLAVPGDAPGGQLGQRHHLVQRGGGRRRRGRRTPGRADGRPPGTAPRADDDQRHLDRDGSGRRLPRARPRHRRAGARRPPTRRVGRSPSATSGASRRTPTGWTRTASDSASEAGCLGGLGR